MKAKVLLLVIEINNVINAQKYFIKLKWQNCITLVFSMPMSVLIQNNIAYLFWTELWELLSDTETEFQLNNYVIAVIYELH